jgi:hypothetical protein
MRENFNKYLSLSVKLILILSIFTSINNHLWHIASTNLFLLILTFAPEILKSRTKIKFPREYEFILLIFVLITMVIGKINSFLIPIIFGLGVGLIGLFISFILYVTNQIKKNPFLILFFSFNFALSFGVALELTKYYLKLLMGQTINEGIYSYTMMNLTYVLIGAVISVIVGYAYMKTKFSIIGKIINKLKKTNPEIFKNINSLEELVKEIKEGESEIQEFKSTLRTNLYTKEKDKNIENTILKTLTGFMNSNGGRLYIGVTDEGKILGIEKDNFENIDKFNLHLTNLIKQKIGKKHLNLIKINIIKIKDRHISRVEIKNSKSPVFLKEGKDEFFYSRIGPQTTEIKGSELIEYVEKKFKKKN